ncbi:flotillin-like protein FloA [Tichowtungia aerotolerans]|uniref:Flotillin-like protein FloA n=1 Tax=Tichowtungia aerotolerans TaxID=2697043 RepID=A0A6P1M7P8_9BACT|nr:flotillin-like protein FloA [Tichowtungia aerotolerans]QHI70739.1 flotillin-like protein FloA [Tichowtungia aerotolerans]
MNILTILSIIVLLVAAFVFIIILSVAAAWVQAWGSGAKVKISRLLGMKILRKVPVMLVTRARIQAAKAGIDINTDLLEAHYLARGNVMNVVQALIAADKANIELSFQQAAAIDLAGRDILDAVTTSVNPKVIDCPNPEKGNAFLDAVAKDGIRLLIKARVTVRTNLEQLVGGATEETIIARVGQGIVSAVGSMESYKNVLENPDHISRKVLDSGLDAQTAFEIVSIDIADVSVAGTANTANVGAQLETERAEADKKMRQAEAEGRRAMAIAAEQEMRARVQEMQSKVIEAQAQVPLAIAQAFKDGNLGVMDFYKMQNVMADTSMRESLAGGDEEIKGE